MRPSTELRSLLEAIPGSGQVYFQPPPGFQMVYPCIVFGRNRARTKFADNNPYRYVLEYSITVMDKNPNSPILDKVASLPMCLFERHFTADNLNHDVFTIYF